MTSHDHSATPQAGPAQVRTFDDGYRISTQCAICHENIEMTSGPQVTLVWLHLDVD